MRRLFISGIRTFGEKGAARQRMNGERDEKRRDETVSKLESETEEERRGEENRKEERYLTMIEDIKSLYINKIEDIR